MRAGTVVEGGDDSSLRKRSMVKLEKRKGRVWCEPQPARAATGSKNLLIAVAPQGLGSRLAP